MRIAEFVLGKLKHNNDTRLFTGMLANNTNLKVSIFGKHLKKQLDENGANEPYRFQLNNHKNSINYLKIPYLNQENILI